jgi:hypothetical protein
MVHQWLVGRLSIKNRAFTAKSGPQVQSMQKVGEWFDNQTKENNNFIRYVRTVIGLSFTAALVNGDLLSLFNRSLEYFLRHQYSPNSRIGSLKVGKATADIVTLGSDFFRLLNHPRYYEDFLQALRDSLGHIMGEMGIPVSADAEHVIELIYNDLYW